MLFLYDVWVNWFAGEEYGYNVCAFHEWRNTDEVEVLEQVPILHVSENFYADVENGLLELPKQLLEKIYQKTFVRRGYNRKTLDYVCILTDGRGVLAIDTIGYRVPFKKSRLIPKQEQAVIDLIHKQKQIPHNYSMKKNKSKPQELRIFPNEMYGLTRRERQMKRLLIIAVHQLKKTSNKREVMYWLVEFIGNDFDEAGSFEVLWGDLLQIVQAGWSNKHKEVCRNLIRGNVLLESLWKLECIANQNISK